MRTKSKCNFADHFVHQLSRGFESAFAEKRINRAFDSEEVREKPPAEVLQWSHGSKMATTSEQTCKLAYLISTIPTKTASAERNFSAFSRNKIYVRPTQSRQTESSLTHVNRGGPSYGAQ